MLTALRSPRSLPIAAVTAAAASLVPSAAAAAALALAGGLALRRATAGLPRRERLTALALAGAVALALLAEGLGTVVAERAAARSASELAASHEALWQELGRFADAAVARLVAGDSPPASRAERFERLRAAAAADERMNFLLWDEGGDLDAWWGPGLLPDLQRAARGDGERGVSQSVLAATLHVARRFRDGESRAWTLTAGESFPRGGPPPDAHAVRERSRGVEWKLVAAGADAAAHWRLSTERVSARFAAGARLRAAARIAGGLLLLTLAAASRPSRRRADVAAAGLARSLPLTVIWLSAAAGSTLLASGAGATGASAVALVTAVLVLGAAWHAGPWPLSSTPVARSAGVVLGAAVGPLVLLLAARTSGIVGDRVGELSLLAPSAAAWRLALSLGVLAAWVVAAASAPEPTAWGRDGLRLADVWPAAAAAAATLLVDFPWPAAAALALAGAGAVWRSQGRVRRRPAERLGLLLLASIVAGASWSAGARLAERRALVASLPAQLPPSPERIAAFAASVERDLTRLDPAALLPVASPVALPEDMAFALWRRSPLDRRDLLSALVVVAPDGERSVFSSGLPIDEEGRLDMSPTRWVDLAPTAWIERRTGGETVRRDARGGPWLVRWLAVPLPGFEAAGAAGERRGDAVAGAPGVGGDLSRDARVVIYDARGRVVRSPWVEGTPAYRQELFAGARFDRVVASPAGPAFVAARAGSGVTAALLLPRAEPWQALERAGSFVAGAWLPWGAVVLAVGLLGLPWRSIRDEARLVWRSYSRRLVLVFTLVLLAPLAVGSTWVAHSYARRLARQQERAALDALHSAQRILGEYVLSLEPGFGVSTAVDDRLLEWLARVVSSEVHLYWGSELYASSKRDLFAAGLRPARLAGEIWERIHLQGERVARRTVRGAGGAAVEIYAPLEIPGLAREATKLVLALPRLAQQDELAAEIAAIRRRAFLAAGALALLLAAAGAVLARRFARPIEEIVRGTQRIAEGASTLGYAPDELELEALTAAIDRMAARVAEARERLLVEKSLVERIAENVTAAVVGLDGVGRVVFANRLGRERLRAAPGTPLLAGLRDAGLDSVADALERATRAAEPVTARVDLGGGEREWTLVRAPLPGPGEPSELVVVEDVTDVVRAQRLDAWAGMARIIAHEIKNPLTPIRLSAEHLREVWTRDREHFAPALERCTDNILRQVEELRRTASEFSLYSEIPRIEPRAGDVREAIREVVEAYRAAPPAGVEIVFAAEGGAVPALFDRRLLGRAVRNLVENAVRASADGGRVEIAVAARPGAVEVRVVDDGPGVPPEHLARVLEPHFSTQSGGTGLGLPIARRVAEEHGGSLTLRNLPAGGLEVTITIPSG